MLLIIGSGGWLESLSVWVVTFGVQESLVMSSITKELELKETRQELETHKQEQSDQQQVFKS